MKRHIALAAHKVYIKENLTIKQTATKFGYKSADTLSKAFKKFGLVTRVQCLGLDAKTKKQAIKLLHEGMTYAQVAINLEINPNSLRVSITQEDLMEVYADTWLRILCSKRLGLF